MEVEKILEERKKTHGDYAVHARVTQMLKRVFRCETVGDKLSNEHKEAIDMIFHKIGRIAAGDPNNQDHWLDISGYATLAMKSCKNDTK